MEQKQSPQIFDTATFESIGSEEEKKPSQKSGPGTYVASPSGGFVLQGAPKPVPAKVDAGKKAKKKSPKKNSLAPETDSGVNKSEQKTAKTVRVDKIKLDSDSVFPENPYYSHIASKYSVLKIVSVILTVTFCIGMFVFYNVTGSQALTVNAFQYLLKDLDFSSLNTGIFDTMVYSGGADADFAAYRGDLVVVTNGVTTLFKTSGAVSFTSENDYYSPRLLTSSKYFLVYDVGNTSYGYSVYNSFAELVSEHLEYPITGAALADNGSYAIVSRDDNYRSIIYVYDYNLKKVLEIRKEKYVVATDISDDGKRVYTASVYDVEGDFECEISFVDVDSGTEKVSLTVESSIPMCVKELDNGNVAVMYTDKISVYGSDGIKYTDIEPSMQSQVFGFISRDLICMSNNSAVIGNDKTVRIFNTDGREIYSGVHSGEQLKITSYEGNVYILFQDRVLKIDPKTKKFYHADIQANAIDIVFTTSGQPYVCFSGSALPLTFVQQNTEEK